MKKTNKTVGVVIGRFQLANLHEGHKYLIDIAKKESDELCILLGSNGGAHTKRNPISFLHRKDMILEHYPDAKVFEIFDSPSSGQWSKNVDSLLEENFKNKTISLYGSRDSFAKDYFGNFNVINIEPIHNISGTELRNKISDPKDKESFRLGIIDSHKTRFSISYQTVDMIILDEVKGNIVLGKKKNSDKWCLPGGFVDPTDLSLEDAVKRELKEEVLGIEVDENVKYLGSLRVNDYRYRKEEDKILTALFLINWKSGEIKAGDDLEEVKWFPLGEVESLLQESHAPLLDLFLRSLI